MDHIKNMNHIKKVLIFLTLIAAFFMPTGNVDTIKAMQGRHSLAPDQALAKKAMFLAFEMTFKPYDLPISLFDLQGVKKISIKEGAKESFVEFNAQGQWIKAGSNRDTVFLTYKNGAPDLIRNENGPLYEFHYAGDTVFTVNNGKIDLYLSEGDFLLKRKTYLKLKGDSSKGLPFKKGALFSSYLIQADTGQGLKLIPDLKAKVEDEEQINSLFGDAESVEAPMMTEMSNTHWQYPFYAAYKIYDHSAGNWKMFKKEYDKNQEGNLAIKYLIDHYIHSVIFLLEHKRPVKMLSSVQILSKEAEPKVIHTSDLEKIYFTYTNFSE